MSAWKVLFRSLWGTMASTWEPLGCFTKRESLMVQTCYPYDLSVICMEYETEYENTILCQKLRIHHRQNTICFGRAIFFILPAARVDYPICVFYFTTAAILFSLSLNFHHFNGTMSGNKRKCENWTDLSKKARKQVFLQAYASDYKYLQNSKRFH